MGCGISLPVPEKHGTQLNFCFKEGKEEGFLPLWYETDFGQKEDRQDFQQTPSDLHAKMPLEVSKTLISK